MADRLVVLKDGTVQQVGTQEDLYERPATPFVAGFIGSSNMVTGTLRDGKVLQAGGAVLTLAGRYGFEGPCTLALRPERLRLAREGRAQGTVELASYLGAVREHLVRLGPDSSKPGLRLLVRDGTGGPGALHGAGEPCSLAWDLAAERLFDAAGAPVLPQNDPTPVSERMTSHV
jgi:putative spermidine/putrescine transport system ATP-binding protein